MSFFNGSFFNGGFFDVPAVALFEKKRKRKSTAKVIRFSDFENREALAAALKAAIEPTTIIIEPTPPLGENDDDEILLAAVSRLLH